MTFSSPLFTKLLACIVFACCFQVSLAQTYPSQPLKLVMPFAPGTAAENGLRLLADKLGGALGLPGIWSIVTPSQVQDLV